MASTFTDRLKLERQSTGESDGTWGTKLNDVLDLIDKAIAGVLSKSVAGSSDVTLTDAEAREAVQIYTGTLTGNINVIVPAREKTWIVHNNTSGSFSLTVKTAAGSGIAVPQGEKAILYCDGTDVLDATADFFRPSTPTIEDTDAGATEAPTLILDRNSASPADNDLIGALALRGRDDGGNATDYAKVAAQILDVTDTEEDASLLLQAMLDGTLTTILTLRKTIIAGKAVDFPALIDVASATTTDIGAAAGNFVRITGTTGITGLGTANAGVWRVVRFAGALTLTHNATSLILPRGGANITTAANDGMLAISLGSGNWWVPVYARANGEPVTVPGLPRGHLAGLQLSNNATDGDHDIDIAAGEARNADNDGDLTLAAALTKQIDVNWASGNNAGGFPSGLTLSADTWYHVFIVDDSNGDVDAGFDTSLTAANLLTDTGGSKYRRIGSVLTDGSSNILAFHQNGDEFWWGAPILDENTNAPGTTAVLVTLSVPTGIRVKAFANARIGDTHVYYSSPDVDDLAPSSSAAPLSIGESTGGTTTDVAHWIAVWTNTSAQIRRRHHGNTQSLIATLGWLDRRGRDD